MTEDEMVGWHHQLNGHGFGWTPGAGDGQGGPVCCSPWVHTPERLNGTELSPVEHLVLRFCDQNSFQVLHTVPVSEVYRKAH